MKMIVIQENTKPAGSRFKIANGLSILVEKDGRRILFDTGIRDLAVRNAAALGVNLAAVDGIVISHGHKDHTGSLLRILQLNDQAPVYLKKEATDPHYLKLPFVRLSVGINPQIMRRYSSRLVFLDTIREIAPDMFLVPRIDHDFPLPGNTARLFAEENGRIVADTWKHEIYMVIREHGKLVILTGCGHSGVRNIVASAQKAFPGEVIGAVIGGFHLQMGGAAFGRIAKSEVAEIAQWLKAYGVEKVYTGHCSGDYGIATMKPFLGDRLERISTGTIINL